jgi:hypothetical protein
MNFFDIRVKSKYKYDSESVEHERTKKGVYNCLRKNDKVNKLFVREEFMDFDVNRRPDVGGIHNGKQLAVEVVHLNEDFNEYMAKEEEYFDEGIYTFWLYTPERIQEYMDNDMEPSYLMKDFKRKYGCIYYYNTGKLHSVNYINDEWVEIPVKYPITWDTLCFAELKYKKYCCVEQKHMVDWLVSQTKKFVKDGKQQLNEFKQSQEPEKIKRFIRFEENEPVTVIFVGFDTHPRFQHPVTVFRQNEELFFAPYHTDLVKQLVGHENKECTVTLLEKGAKDSKAFKYKVEVLE